MSLLGKILKISVEYIFFSHFELNTCNFITKVINFTKMLISRGVGRFKPSMPFERTIAVKMILILRSFIFKHKWFCCLRTYLA